MIGLVKVIPFLPLLSGTGAAVYLQANDPSNWVGSVGTFGLGAVISMAMIAYHRESAREHRAAMKELVETFTATLKEVAKDQSAVENKLLDVISANTASNREVAKSLETMASFRSIEETIRELLEQKAK